MQFDARLIGDAAALARAHEEVLGRLPATVRAFVLVELQKWPALFAPEQRYQRALLGHLSRLPAVDLQQAVAGIARIEGEAGVSKLAGGDPGRFQEDAQALLRTRKVLPAWRKEVDTFFQRIDPALESELYPANAPRRLVVQLYGRGIAVQADKLWSRFKGTGVRVPLTLDGAAGTEAFLRALFGGRDSGAGGPALFAAARTAANLDPLDAWLIESHEALHDLFDGGTAGRYQLQPAPVSIGWPEVSLTGLSYDRLRQSRDDLTRALYAKIQSGVESPQAFAAYRAEPEDRAGSGAMLHSADILRTFVRDVLLRATGRSS